MERHGGREPLQGAAQPMRLDEYLAANYDFDSRNKAREAVRYGLVTVNGRLSKPAYEVKEGDKIVVTMGQAVSNGGSKLSRAFKTFPISALGRVCLDAGASTGGFTQVLLEQGAVKVYAVDVGRNQLHPSLREDNRVTVMDETNVRTLCSRDFAEPIEFLCSDLSFISLKLVLPVFAELLSARGDLVVLVKPQFEAGPRFLGKNGIVRDKRVHQRVLEEIVAECSLCGLVSRGLIRAPLRERDMNVEYLLWANREGQAIGKKDIIEAVMRPESLV